MIILRQKEYSGRRPIVYLLCGLPGSGKSTWCRENHPFLPVVSRDIIRYELGYTSDPSEKARLSESQENKVTIEENKRIQDLIRSKKDFILDDTNLRKKYRTPLINTLESAGYYVVGVVFETPLSVCIRRRSDQIFPAVMQKLWNGMDRLDDSEVNEIINVK